MYVGVGVWEYGGTRTVLLPNSLTHYLPQPFIHIRMQTIGGLGQGGALGRARGSDAVAGEGEPQAETVQLIHRLGHAAQAAG